MRQLSKIKDYTETVSIIEFAEFILGELKGRTFVDYQALDLMKIPQLVPGIFAYDIKNSSDKLKMHYCGTEIDWFYGRNMTGKMPIDYYPEFEPISEIYKKAVASKRPCFTLRNTRILNDRVDKHTTIETILVPCSQNGEDINYTVAYADFRPSNSPNNSLLYLIDP
jgi:hypothetical protein